MFAAGYRVESFFKFFPEKGIISFTEKMRPGKLDIKFSEVYKWLFLSILDIEKDDAMDLKAPAFKIEEFGSYTYD